MLSAMLDETLHRGAELQELNAATADLHRLALGNAALGMDEAAQRLALVLQEGAELVGLCADRRMQPMPESPVEPQPRLPPPEEAHAAAASGSEVQDLVELFAIEEAEAAVRRDLMGEQALALLTAREAWHEGRPGGDSAAAAGPLSAFPVLRPEGPIGEVSAGSKEEGRGNLESDDTVAAVCGEWEAAGRRAIVDEQSSVVMDTVLALLQSMLSEAQSAAHANRVQCESLEQALEESKEALASKERDMEALRDAQSDADAGVQQREVARAEAERRAVIGSEHRAALNALRDAEESGRAVAMRQEAESLVHAEAAARQAIADEQFTAVMDVVLPLFQSSLSFLSEGRREDGGSVPHGEVRVGAGTVQLDPHVLSALYAEAEAHGRRAIADEQGTAVLDVVLPALRSMHVCLRAEGVSAVEQLQLPEAALRTLTLYRKELLRRQTWALMHEEVEERLFLQEEAHREHANLVHVCRVEMLEHAAVHQRPYRSTVALVQEELEARLVLMDEERAGILAIIAESAVIGRSERFEAPDDAGDGWGELSIDSEEHAAEVDVVLPSALQLMHASMRAESTREVEQLSRMYSTQLEAARAASDDGGEHEAVFALVEAELLERVQLLEEEHAEVLDVIGELEFGTSTYMRHTAHDISTSASRTLTMYSKELLRRQAWTLMHDEVLERLQLLEEAGAELAHAMEQQNAEMLQLREMLLQEQHMHISALVQEELQERLLVMDEERAAFVSFMLADRDGMHVSADLSGISAVDVGDELEAEMDPALPAALQLLHASMRTEVEQLSRSYSSQLDAVRAESDDGQQQRDVSALVEAELFQRMQMLEEEHADVMRIISELEFGTSSYHRHTTQDISASASRTLTMYRKELLRRQAWTLMHDEAAARLHVIEEAFKEHADLVSQRSTQILELRDNLHDQQMHTSAFVSEESQARTGLMEEEHAAAVALLLQATGGVDRRLLQESFELRSGLQHNEADDRMTIVDEEHMAVLGTAFPAALQLVHVSMRAESTREVERLRRSSNAELEAMRLVADDGARHSEVWTLVEAELLERVQLLEAEHAEIVDVMNEMRFGTSAYLQHTTQDISTSASRTLTMYRKELLRRQTWTLMHDELLDRLHLMEEAQREYATLFHSHFTANRAIGENFNARHEQRTAALGLEELEARMGVMEEENAAAVLLLQGALGIDRRLLHQSYELRSGLQHNEADDRMTIVDEEHMAVLGTAFPAALQLVHASMRAESTREVERVRRSSNAELEAMRLVADDGARHSEVWTLVEAELLERVQLLEAEHAEIVDVMNEMRFGTSAYLQHTTQDISTSASRTLTMYRKELLRRQTWTLMHDELLDRLHLMEEAQREYATLFHSHFTANRAIGENFNARHEQRTAALGLEELEARMGVMEEENAAAVLLLQGALGIDRRLLHQSYELRSGLQHNEADDRMTIVDEEHMAVLGTAFPAALQLVHASMRAESTREVERVRRSSNAELEAMRLVADDGARHSEVWTLVEAELLERVQLLEAEHAEIVDVMNEMRFGTSAYLQHTTQDISTSASRTLTMYRKELLRRQTWTLMHDELLDRLHLMEQAHRQHAHLLGHCSAELLECATLHEQQQLHTSALVLEESQCRLRLMDEERAALLPLVSQDTGGIGRRLLQESFELRSGLQHHEADDRMTIVDEEHMAVLGTAFPAALQLVHASMRAESTREVERLRRSSNAELEAIRLVADDGARHSEVWTLVEAELLERVQLLEAEHAEIVDVMNEMRFGTSAYLQHTTQDISTSASRTLTMYRKELLRRQTWTLMHDELLDRLHLMEEAQREHADLLRQHSAEALQHPAMHQQRLRPGHGGPGPATHHKQTLPNEAGDPAHWPYAVAREEAHARLRIMAEEHALVVDALRQAHLPAVPGNTGTMAYSAGSAQMPSLALVEVAEGSARLQVRHLSPHNLYPFVSSSPQRVPRPTPPTHHTPPHHTPPHPTTPHHGHPYGQHIWDWQDHTIWERSSSGRCSRSHRRSGWPTPGLQKAPSRPARGQGALRRGLCKNFNCTSRRSCRESQEWP